MSLNELRGIHLERNTRGMCTVSLDIAGKTSPIISDNGDVISHYVHRGTIDRIAEQTSEVVASAKQAIEVLRAIVRAADGSRISGNLILDENSPLMDAARDVLRKAGLAT